MVENVASNLHYDLIYVRVKNQVGLPGARNVGLLHSSYKIVGFIDDDCFPIRNDFLERAYKWLSLKKYNIIGVGGPIYVRSNEPRFVRSKMKGFKSLFKIKQLLRLFLEILETQNYKLQKLVFVNRIQGGNCFFNKDILELCGGFDQRFDGNYYREDTDVSMSIKKYGMLVSDPRMPVNHIWVKYAGCRRKADEFYSNILSNTIFLIMKHKRIPIEVILDTFFDISGLFKIFFTGFDNDGYKIKRVNFLKSVFKGLSLGFKKDFFPRKKFTPLVIDEKINYPNTFNSD